MNTLLARLRAFALQRRLDSRCRALRSSVVYTGRGTSLRGVSVNFQTGTLERSPLSLSTQPEHYTYLNLRNPRQNLMTVW